MDTPWVGLGELATSERSAAETRLERLAEGHDDLIDLRVSGHQNGHHQHGGKEVRIVCRARGRELVATRTGPEMGHARARAPEAPR